MRKQSQMEVVCTECHSTFNATPKRSFLGFLQFVCPKCNRKVVYPLTSGYRIFYWIVFTYMVIVSVVAFKQGGFAIPGLIGIAVIIALIKDTSIKRKVQSARRVEAFRNARGAKPLGKDRRGDDTLEGQHHEPE